MGSDLFLDWRHEPDHWENSVSRHVNGPSHSHVAIPRSGFLAFLQAMDIKMQKDILNKTYPPVNKHRPWQIGVGRLIYHRVSLFFFSGCLQNLGDGNGWNPGSQFMPIHHAEVYSIAGTVKSDPKRTVFFRRFHLEAYYNPRFHDN